mgnify:CR=1 FL=1
MAWPAIVESFFIAFAGLVDSLMVSSLGSYAVAAVGLTTQPKLLGLAFFFALNVSISALVARRRGEQRQGAANETLVTALVFIILAAAAFSVGFVAFASPIIHLCGSTAETHNGAVTYFRIIMGGMIFNCIQMGINSAQRGAGKSLLCTALCRIFAQDGYRVAPFKSQNMALNSFVTRDGLEMGRAQVVQAQAAGMEPDVRMNPILLKPSSDVGSQVIVNGEVRGQMPAAAYFKLKKSLIPDILAAYNLSLIHISEPTRRS